MEANLKAAVIGYWRSGASIEQIIGLTGLFYLQIARTIEDYNRLTPTPLPRERDAE